MEGEALIYRAAMPCKIQADRPTDQPTRHTLPVCHGTAAKSIEGNEDTSNGKRFVGLALRACLVKPALFLSSIRIGLLVG